MVRNNAREHPSELRVQGLDWSLQRVEEFASAALLGHWRGGRLAGEGGAEPFLCNRLGFL
jgi:hypothetical protein